MRILFISPHIPPRECGVADHIAKQVSELIKGKNQVSILTGIENAGKSGFNDEFIVLALVKKWNIRAYFQLIMAIRTFNPDIVHMHYQISMYAGKSFATIIPFLIKMIRKGIKTAVTLHDLNPPYFFHKYEIIIKKMLYFLVKYSDAVIVSNNMDYKKLSLELPQRVLDRIHLIPIGSNMTINKIQHADKTMIGHKVEDLILGFFGFVAPDKGVEILLEAFGRMRVEYNNLKLLIIGGKGYSKGDFNVYLKRLDLIISAHDMEKDVIFTNYADIEMLRLYLSIIDICVLPYTEGVTTRRTTFFTVMSMGLPTVTTCVNEEYLPEGLEEGKNVRFFKPNDVNGLGCVLKELLGSKREREEMGANAYAWSLKYSNEILYAKLDAIYKKLAYSP